MELPVTRLRSEVKVGQYWIYQDMVNRDSKWSEGWLYLELSCTTEIEKLGTHRIQRRSGVHLTTLPHFKQRIDTNTNLNTHVETVDLYTDVIEFDSVGPVSSVGSREVYTFDTLLDVLVFVNNLTPKNNKTENKNVTPSS